MIASATMSIGRARTVLLSGNPDTAVMSSVVVRTRRGGGEGRLSAAGPATFAPEVMTHFAASVLPAVDAIVDEISCRAGRRSSRRHFEVSLVNLGGASLADLASTVSGFSADAPTFLAMLSAALQLPLPQDIVVTGHLASTDGELRPVHGLPAKLRAAAEDRGIHRFLHASLNADRSIAVLSPRERDRAEAALLAFADAVDLITIDDVFDLIEQTVPPESIVLGSLRRGFFEVEGDVEEPGTPVARAAALLVEGNERRFWVVLEHHLLAGHGASARRLLKSRVRYQVRRQRYPSGLGRKLDQLVRGLPPTTRRRAAIFPLLSKDECLALFRWAQAEDLDDVPLLMEAATGRTGKRAEDPRVKDLQAEPVATDADAAVQAVLEQISAETLAAEIGTPIDTARAGYVLNNVICDSADEFFETVEAFYLTLKRRCGMVTHPTEAEDLADEASKLLSSAFAREGGAIAAQAEARDGLRGGMRFVLDAMTEHFKREQQAERVERVLLQALDALNWDQRVAFMEALLRRIGPQLPADIRNKSPRQFARHYDEIVRAYAQSLDHVKQLLRTL